MPKGLSLLLGQGCKLSVTQQPFGDTKSKRTKVKKNTVRDGPRLPAAKSSHVDGLEVS